MTFKKWNTHKHGENIPNFTAIEFVLSCIHHVKKVETPSEKAYFDLCMQERSKQKRKNKKICSAKYSLHRIE